LLILDKVNLDLLCPRWLPHCCHVGRSGLLRAEKRIRLSEGCICMHKGHIRKTVGCIRLPEGRIQLVEGHIWLPSGRISPPKTCVLPPQPFTPPPRPFAPSSLSCVPPIHARNSGVEIYLTFECAMSTYSINEG
jgi:hypothetical protein